MASSEQLTNVEPWSSFRSNFNLDSWLIPDPFSHDTDLLAKALNKSISTVVDPLSPSPFFDSTTVLSDLSPPQTLSNVSFGSDPELATVNGAKRKRNGPGVSGKPLKRRARVSTKKSQTTFITADAANFRQMVQQVTGAKFIGGGGYENMFCPIVKPEPHRLVSRVQQQQQQQCVSSSSVVPTLDTSSFLSNHHQELGSVSAPVGSFHHQTSDAVTTTVDVGGAAVELDSYPSFPTLESWKVM